MDGHMILVFGWLFLPKYVLKLVSLLHLAWGWCTPLIWDYFINWNKIIVTLCIWCFFPRECGDCFYVTSFSSGTPVMGMLGLMCLSSTSIILSKLFLILYIFSSLWFSFKKYMQKILTLCKSNCLSTSSKLGLILLEIDIFYLHFPFLHPFDLFLLK